MTVRIVNVKNRTEMKMPIFPSEGRDMKIVSTIILKDLPMQTSLQTCNQCAHVHAYARRQRLRVMLSSV